MKILRYKRPAKKWIDALPLGNGLMGAMVYGGIKKERIAFNNSALWSGYPKNHDNKESLERLEEVRELIFNGENHLADKLTEEKLDGAYSEGYLPLGELNVEFKGINVGKYVRRLDIQNGLFSLTAGSNEREAFCSYPKNLFAYKTTAKLPFSAKITALAKMPNYDISYGERVVLSGIAPDHVKPSYLGKVQNPVEYNELLGMAYALVAKVETNGKTHFDGSGYYVENATEMIIYATTDTGFIGYDKMPCSDANYPIALCNERLDSISDDYDTIKDEHIKDFSTLYNKHSLTLAKDNGQFADSLYYKAKLGKITPELISLFYNYGKYLTISGSRKGGQALNLQGVWNDNIRPPWSSNYTSNINSQMNYWPTSQVGLSECLAPYIDMVYELSISGKSTAQTNFGANGFTSNHNTDIWRKTSPVKGNPQYMYAPLCGAWYANEIYEHYSYGGLEEYKEKIASILRANVEFILDYLVLHNGYYVTCPSASPENTFLKDGKHCYLDYASAFEMGIVKQSLINYLDFFLEDDLTDKVKERLSRLYPFKEGPDGLVEWSQYFPTPEMGHRHFSPLYAFHPARAIGYYSHPVEREWVRKLMHTRIFNVKHYYGWSGAWALAISARLREKDTVALVISRVLGKAIFKNLFDMHPPRLFQIDGNFGFTHGINEALCQIEGDTLELLPALPDYLSCGQVEGQRLTGGYVVDFKWENGKVTYFENHGDTTINILNKNLAENATIINAQIVKE